MIRLQKVLAERGVASRRAAEELIVSGRVRVDGRVARELGTRVPPDASLEVDGRAVAATPQRRYLVMNKPRGVVSTARDERGRRTVLDLLGARERLYPVGRLDADSEGLLLLTNDGELAHRLTHPSYGVPKTYLCEVPGPVAKSVARQLLAGIELDDGPAKADAFRVLDSLPPKALVEVVLHEGRNRIVRRMLEAVGHPVKRLIRTQIGPIRLGDLPPGKTRRLGVPEVGALYRAVDL